MLDILWRDLRYASRMLLRQPGFTAAAMLALALGIGANTAIFTVVDSVLLRPLPFKESDSVILISGTLPSKGYLQTTISLTDLVAWREQNDVFENIAAYADLYGSYITGGDQPESAPGLEVSPGFFRVLGVEPIVGRGFLQEEERPGSPPAVIISEGLWKRRFGGDPDAIGKIIKINGDANTLVGVMPPVRLAGAHVMPAPAPALTYNPDVYLPIAFDAKTTGANWMAMQLYNAIGRLKRGVTLQNARTQMDIIAARINETSPAEATAGINLVSLHEQMAGDIRSPLLILLAASGFVVLIACANVANLLLARTAGRQKEIAIRSAIGAGRLRLVRQFMTESMLLAALGGAAGLLSATWGMHALSAFIPENLYQARSLSIDLRVLAFAMASTVIAALLFGLAPALQASRPHLNEALKKGGMDSAQGSSRRMRDLVVAAEIALTLMLLAGAGLMIKSFVRLSRVDPGFDTENLLTMRLDGSYTAYSKDSELVNFINQTMERIKAIPGVEGAAVTNRMPILEEFPMSHPEMGSQEDISSIYPNFIDSITPNAVSNDYLQTMGASLLKGRHFDERDTGDSTPVAIVSETTARHMWPDRDPIGEHIRINSRKPEFTVVGVVADMHDASLRYKPSPQLFAPYTQFKIFRPDKLLVRVKSNPMALAETIRDTIWSVNKDQPVSNMQPMSAILAESKSKERFNLLLLGLFAGVALILAAVGIYGVMSYSVARRIREIGIRMALGAQGQNVVRLVMKQVLAPVAIGMVIGLSAAAALTRLAASLFFGVSTRDPATFALVSLGMAAVACMACYLPALRATKVDPMTALRSE